MSEPGFDPAKFLAMGQAVLQQQAFSQSKSRKSSVSRMPSASAPAHSTSNTPAAPMPPPMHIVTQTFFAPRRLPSISAWPVRRWPLTP